jgi:hypothetical protein
MDQNILFQANKDSLKCVAKFIECYIETEILETDQRKLGEFNILSKTVTYKIRLIACII